MEKGIENFAGVIIQNPRGEILLVRKIEHHAYAIPWCRLTAGKSLKESLRERVKDLTGLTVSPVFLGPNEHITGDSHFISFDHTAKVDTREHHFVREGLDYLWVDPEEFDRIPLVPLTRKILDRHFSTPGSPGKP